MSDDLMNRLIGAIATLNRVEVAQTRIEAKLDILIEALQEEDEPITSLDGFSTARPRDDTQAL